MRLGIRQIISMACGDRTSVFRLLPLLLSTLCCAYQFVYTMMIPEESCPFKFFQNLDRQVNLIAFADQVSD